MQYDKLELLIMLCASETPVTLKSLINTFTTSNSRPYECGCSIKKEHGEVIGLDIYTYYRRNEDEAKPYTAAFEVKLKGLVYKVHFTAAEKDIRSTKKYYSVEDEVMIFKISRRLPTAYEDLILAERNI